MLSKPMSIINILIGDPGFSRGAFVFYKLERGAAMNQEHEIVAMVSAAKGDSLAADELVRRFLPFIRSEAAKAVRRGVSESDDELSIAMMAFHEAVLAYERLRGAFLPFAAKAIRSRIIDFHRREQRHRGHLSLHEKNEEDDRELAETLDAGTDPISSLTDRTAARQEIAHFALGLSEFGLSLTDIADNCPKQTRTLAACHRALEFAKGDPELLEQTVRSGKLPITALAAGAGVERKTLERHRKYMMALILAYTNGFEIIRGHLGQMALVKGGR